MLTGESICFLAKAKSLNFFIPFFEQYLFPLAQRIFGLNNYASLSCFSQTLDALVYAYFLNVVSLTN